MRAKRCMFGGLSVTVLTLATGLFAKDAVPATGQEAGPAASDSSVPAQDYRALKQEVDQLRQRVDSQDKQLAAATRPASPTTFVPSDPCHSSFFLESDKLGAEFQTLFAARTDREYLSPFGVMDPAHMRPDMPLEVGAYRDLQVYMSLQTVGRFQAIQQNDVFVKGAKQPGINPGFQDPFANLSFLATIPGKLDVFADLYVASRPHASTMYGHEGYLLFKQLPAPFDAGPAGKVFDYLNVKVGAFDIDFGDDNYRRSNNAFVQRNPLIDNPLVDPNVEEIGGEVYSIKGPVYWLAGVGSGTTTEHFDYGGEPSFHGKIWGYPCREVRLSASAYYVNLARSNDTSYLFANGRSGGALAAVFAGGDNPGQVLPQAGKNVTAVQGDLTWLHWPVELYSNVGWTQDSNTNGKSAGTPAERWTYATVEPVYHITPSLYVAGRYSFAMAQSVHGVPTDGWVDRAEIGAGYWITESILGKVEYLYEQYHGFHTAAGVVNGIDAARGPRFNGAVVEVSFQF